MMAEKNLTQSVEDWATLYKAFCFDLPLASVKWRLGIGQEKGTAEAAWAGYDAGVRLTTTAIDTLYRTPSFGEVAARSLNIFLRGQQISNALAGAFFTGLWQTVGLPTAAETQTLRTEIQALREEVRASRAVPSVQPKKKRALTAIDTGQEPPSENFINNGVMSNGIHHPVRSAA
jgi:hypothetical protein